VVVDTPPLGSCSGIASGGYRSGQLQQTAGACTGAKNVLLTLTKALHKHKSHTFPPNINRVETSHLAEDLTGE
jgi:hypothetical protein